MSDAYILELGVEPVGLVTREDDGYRFYAAKRSFRALEGRVFDSAENARDAAVDLFGEDAPASALTSLAVAAHM
ncbi:MULTISPECIES: hypothetical protein [Methylosinus]|uniref:Uncharacterized protein n=1 Tax=Methylosinus trichosporium (strain ATCC 35070 / NCIMB 11131 / UNIQEM 75 / OB3b) TaxID=595536 RepID=A0A2D2D0C2_METT3|nr:MULTISPECIES: hypothetical protein [Methylosinus]ATQ68329.1 hypothetical protein CQW49_10895 [Methylosinus trichosporium OB3b]OBS50932.1 hypothetical protein A8B73_18765 [Methylosinus sp. 3S-1]